jgi:ABC-2 type transport system ATP-binding protein
MILFSSVSKTYPREIISPANIAISELSFSLHKGETVGLIGANGAGKSTTIKLLMDFIRPDTGTIRLFGHSPRIPRLRQKIGYLPETANFPANLTVMDLLRYTGSTCAVPQNILDQRSHELLTLLDLWEVRRRSLRTYSKGMQQRANFAIALINDPELLILDEPMSGLDPMGRKKIIDLIGQLKNAGKTILFCSHILEDVDRLVDSVLLLHKGKKLFHGTPGELITQEDRPSMAEAFVCRVKREENHV